MKFSIIIPTYNRAPLLPATIASALSQDWDDFEVIVVDDGSTDSTPAIVDAIEDERLRYFRKDNEERNIARNFGAAQASGDYLNFLDSDDHLFPNHLSVAARLIEQRDRPEVIHLGARLVDQDGRFVHAIEVDDAINERLADDNDLAMCGVLLRRDIARAYPFIPSPCAVVGEDHYLWLRLAARFPIHFDNTVTSQQLEHPGRSLRAIDPERLAAGTREIIETLAADSAFMNFYGSRARRHFAHRYCFLCLHQTMAGQRREGWQSAWLAFRNWPPVVFDKRFLAPLKKLVLGTSGDSD